MSSILSCWRRRSSSMACQRTGSTCAMVSSARPLAGEIVIGRRLLPCRRGQPPDATACPGRIFPRTRRSPMIRGLLDEDEVAALETPLVVVDLDRTDQRIAAMAAFMRDRGIALRPHAKTHKSVEIARRQIAAGASGLTVATIGEAEVFADAGLTDLFIAYPLVVRGPAVDRLPSLAERSHLSVGADSVAGLEALAGAVSGAESTVRVLIEIDSGGARTGVRPAEAGGLARHAAGLGLTVAGAFTHEGHGYRGGTMRSTAGDDAATALEVAAAALRDAGFEPTVLSAGSTPTAEASARGIPPEERRGTSVFGDRLQAAIAGDRAGPSALMVATTVVSAGSGGGFV